MKSPVKRLNEITGMYNAANKAKQASIQKKKNQEEGSPAEEKAESPDEEAAEQEEAPLKALKGKKK